MKIDELFILFEKRKSQFASLNHNRMVKLLEYLGNPHIGLKYIHVAGTNGKGSTSNFIYSILKCGGYRAGLYTSPHILKYNERIKINDADISDSDLIRISEEVLEAEKKIEREYGSVSLFELITAVAFIYFKEQKTDYVVLEVGMGGLSDSTNVVRAEDKLAQVITPVSMDHTQFLGKNLQEIAYQKAGIIKKNVLTPTSNTEEIITDVIRKKAAEENSPYISLEEMKIENLYIDDYGCEYDAEFNGERLKNIKIKLAGYYQMSNSALALMTIMKLRQNKLLDISDEAIYTGLLTAKWPGRMETLMEKPHVVIDGAHNLDGIKNLTKNLSLYSYDRLYIVTSILEDKEHDKMLKELSEYADEIVLTGIHSKRKTDLNLLKNEIEKENVTVNVEEDLQKAVNSVMEKAGERDLILITGSLYLLSEVKEKIKWSV